MAKPKTKQMSGEAIELVADRFKVLSEPLRLKILQLLQDGERSVTELTALTGTSQPNISKHLKLMQSAGILSREQRGNTVFYSIADETIFTLCDVVCGSLSDRLKTQAGIFG